MLTETDKIIIQFLVEGRDWKTRKEIADAFEKSNYSQNPATVAVRMKRFCKKVGYDCIVVRRKRIPHWKPIYIYRANIPALINKGYIQPIPWTSCFRWGA